MSMKKRKVSDIQSVIMTVLSLMTVITSISMGLLLYNRYEMAMRQNEVRNTQNLMESTVNSMEQYLKNMRQISDTVTYNIIQASYCGRASYTAEGWHRGALAVLV